MNDSEQVFIINTLSFSKDVITKFVNDQHWVLLDIDKCLQIARRPIPSIEEKEKLLLDLAKRKEYEAETRGYEKAIAQMRVWLNENR